MDKFMGKFKAVDELTEGLDAYFNAMKMPDEAREIMRKSLKSLVSGLAKEGGDSYREFSDYGDRKEEFVFQLGVPMTTTVMGMETKNTFKLNGDRIDGVHEVGGETTTSSRYYKGDLLVFESEGNGATMKTFFKKMSD